MPGKEPVAKSRAAVKASAPSKFVSRPKDFGIGQNVPYSRDISRFMRWPAFVTRQRKKRVLERRLKVPPALNQFRQVLDRSTRTELFKLVKKYDPETRKARQARIRGDAQKAREAKGKAPATKKPQQVVTGLQEVTRSIESKKARLVVIANNVDPIELVMWMPTLCRSMKIPYAIVKDKARLGELVGQKTCACVAIEAVRGEDEKALKDVVKSVNARFLARSDVIRRKWGGLQLSLRSQARLAKKRGKVQKIVAAAEE